MKGERCHGASEVRAEDAAWDAVGGEAAERVRISRLPTSVLPPARVAAIRALLWAAFGEGEDAMRELGALGTGRHSFYERLGWRTWLGRTSVRTAEGLQPTPDEDGYILVLATPTSPELNLHAPITCHWRPGDVG